MNSEELDVLFFVHQNLLGTTSRIFTGVMRGDLSNDSRKEIARILRWCADTIERKELFK